MNDLGPRSGQASTSGSRTCLVAGAAGGLGAAISGRFLTEGWRVLGWDLAPIEDDRIDSTQIDLTDWDAVAAEAETLPPLNAVVNSTGIASRTTALEMKPTELDEVLRVNLTAAFALSQAVLPVVRAERGTIVHIASIGGHLGFRARLAYDTSKAGMLAMVQHLAVEWAPLGVRVISVSPGFVQTGMAARGIESGQTRLQDIIDHTPTGRLVEPDEVAGVVIRLVGEDFTAVTGSDILVDGGFAALSGF